MREILIILLVIAVLVGLTAIRYRRQIVAAIKIWRSLKAMKQQMTERSASSTPKESVSAGPLVNCARCGTWVPEQRAIRLRGGGTYCSAECLEKTGTAR